MRRIALHFFCVGLRVLNITLLNAVAKKLTAAAVSARPNQTLYKGSASIRRDVKMARKIGEILWLAFQYAKQDRQSLIDAYRGNTSEEAVRDAMSDIKAFQKLQLKLFGTTQSELEAQIAKMRPVDIFKLVANKELLKTDDFHAATAAPLAYPWPASDQTQHRLIPQDID